MRPRKHFASGRDDGFESCSKKSVLREIERKSLFSYSKSREQAHNGVWRFRILSFRELLVAVYGATYSRGTFVSWHQKEGLYFLLN
jgi:hypothetical protein